MDGCGIDLYYSAGSLIAAVMFFWICPKGYAREQIQMGREKKIGKWLEPVTKYLFVGITFAVYVLGIFLVESANSSRKRVREMKEKYEKQEKLRCQLQG